MKLTNEKRNSILSKAVIGVFALREEKAKKESAAIAQLIYDRCYPTDMQTAMKKMPDGYFQEVSHVFVQLVKRGAIHQFNLLSSQRISAMDRQYQLPCWKVPEAEQNSAIARRIMKLLETQNKIDSDQKEFIKQLRSMLYGITTMKRLQEEWPDGAVYYKSFETVPANMNVPSVRGADITALMLQLTEV